MRPLLCSLLLSLVFSACVPTPAVNVSQTTTKAQNTVVTSPIYLGGLSVLNASLYPMQARHLASDGLAHQILAAKTDIMLRSTHASSDLASSTTSDESTSTGLEARLQSAEIPAVLHQSSSTAPVDAEARRWVIAMALPSIMLIPDHASGSTDVALSMGWIHLVVEDRSRRDGLFSQLCSRQSDNCELRELTPHNTQGQLSSLLESVISALTYRQYSLDYRALMELTTLPWDFNHNIAKYTMERPDTDTPQWLKDITSRSSFAAYRIPVRQTTEESPALSSRAFELAEQRWLDDGGNTLQETLEAQRQSLAERGLLRGVELRSVDTLAQQLAGRLIETRALRRGREARLSHELRKARDRRPQ